MKLERNHLNTILAALRLRQHRLTHGCYPTGDELAAIEEIAGEGVDFASPEDIDDLCEMLNVNSPAGNEEAARTTLQEIHDTLYRDGPDTEWNCDTIEVVAEIVNRYYQ